MRAQCQPWFVNWLRPRVAAVHTLDAVFSSDDAHRLELLLSLLGRCALLPLLAHPTQLPRHHRK
jgi:hypothetical protein